MGNGESEFRSHTFIAAAVKRPGDMLITSSTSPICDSYVRPMTLVRICDECSCPSLPRFLVLHPDASEQSAPLLESASSAPHPVPSFPLIRRAHHPDPPQRSRTHITARNVRGSRRIATGVHGSSTWGTLSGRGSDFSTDAFACLQMGASRVDAFYERKKLG